MVKVLSKDSNNLRSVARHLNYIGRRGDLELETDDGQRAQGKDAGQQLVEDWDLDLDQDRRDSKLSAGTGRAPKLVHKIMLSMPPGTPAKGVLEAARNFAREEFALKHRYALVLHTDEPHPHVHLVLKAVSEQGERLNIRKATLRGWRRESAPVSSAIMALRPTRPSAPFEGRHVRASWTESTAQRNGAIRLTLVHAPSRLPESSSGVSPVPNRVSPNSPRHAGKSNAAGAPPARFSSAKANRNSPLRSDASWIKCRRLGAKRNSSSQLSALAQAREPPRLVITIVLGDEDEASPPHHCERGALIGPAQVPR
jgi:Relaxase/Mobilisation nuclease domain